MPTSVATWQDLYNACSNPTTYAPDGIINVTANIPYGTNSSVYINNSSGINISIQSSGGPFTLTSPTNASSGGNQTRHFTIGYPTAPGNPGFNNPNATVTFDNIILDGGTGASSTAGTTPTPTSSPAASWGGGVLIACGTTTFSSGFTLQNCWTGYANIDNGGYGALCVHSYLYNNNQPPTIVNFSGTVQYNTNGSNNQQYQEAPGGVMIFQRNNNGTGTPVTQFNMTGGSISYNSSFCGGGGVCLDTYAACLNSNEVFNMSAGTISYNTAATVGGGIMCGSQSDDNIMMNISGGTISYNKALGTGTYTMNNAFGQAENGNGGGIWLQDGTTTISGNVVIANNTAANLGGGAYVSLGNSLCNSAVAAKMNVNGGDWYTNSAIQGAAIYYCSNGTLGNNLDVTSGNFHNHSSSGDGAVFAANGAPIVLNATSLPSNLTPTESNYTLTPGTISVFDNKATGNGGVVTISGTQGNNLVNTSFSATNVLFYNNSAGGNGGVLYSTSGPAFTGGTPPTVTNTLIGCILDHNSAGGLGGAYYIGQ